MSMDLEFYKNHLPKGIEVDCRVAVHFFAFGEMIFVK